MKFLTFAIVYPIIWLISRLPMRVLYIFSDFFFFILYYIVGYRKKVVEKNLTMVFPKKSNQEIKKLQKHLTIILISHDDELRSYADNMIDLN